MRCTALARQCSCAFLKNQEAILHRLMVSRYQISASEICTRILAGRATKERCPSVKMIKIFWLDLPSLAICSHWEENFTWVNETPDPEPLRSIVPQELLSGGKDCHGESNRVARREWRLAQGPTHMRPQVARWYRWQLACTGQRHIAGADASRYCEYLAIVA